VGAGFEEFRWPLPVRPRDELRVESEVLEVRTTTLNQNGEAVQVAIGTVVVPRRAT